VTLTATPTEGTEGAGSAFLFRFERDLYPTFHCIPMRVRYKLDMIGLKVPLKAWNTLPLAFRTELLSEWPVEHAEARRELREALLQHFRAAALRLTEVAVRPLPADDEPPWQNTSELPEVLAAQATRCRPSLTVREWAGLGLMQRFALVKLASSKHERDRVAAAVAEFRAARPVADSDCWDCDEKTA
jgi:hypothetical protein